jgi:hypothetical protein
MLQPSRNTHISASSARQLAWEVPLARCRSYICLVKRAKLGALLCAQPTTRSRGLGGHIHVGSTPDELVVVRVPHSNSALPTRCARQTTKTPRLSGAVGSCVSPTSRALPPRGLFQLRQRLRHCLASLINRPGELPVCPIPKEKALHSSLRRPPIYTHSPLLVSLP